MTTLPADPPPVVREVFRQLRARQLALGIDDLMAVREALRAGFGLESQEAFVELCVMLWAKSPSEASTVRMLFPRQDLPDWREAVAPSVPSSSIPTSSSATIAASPPPLPVASPLTITSVRLAGVPPLPVQSSRRIILNMDFPLTRRLIAQTLRRLRRPVRSGPATELDLEATVTRRTRTAVATPAVLVPPRRSTSSLLLLIDRQGSMAPLHPYLDHLRDAISEDGRLAHVVVCYFHNRLCGVPDPRVLLKLSGLFPTLDGLLHEIEPRSDGVVFSDPELLEPVATSKLIDELPFGAGLMVISDAGALRGTYDAERLIDAVSFARAARRRAHRLVWLNPVLHEEWQGSTAGEIRRHLPMFTLDRAGLTGAVNVLRGKPPALERPA